MKKWTGIWMMGILASVLAAYVALAADVKIPPRAPDADHPTLVRNAAANVIPPGNFRSSKMLWEHLKNEPAKRKGLDTLNVSVSGAFSEKGLAWTIKEAGQPVVVVDLRQECHGYLNGAAISWNTQNNWGNVGLPREKVLAAELERLKTLGSQKTASIVDYAKYKKDAKTATEMIEINRVMSEQELVEKAKAGYFRLTVTDHCRPLDDDVDRFVAFVRSLKPDIHVHIHCQAGSGRAPTFTVLYDMLHNADKLSAEDIVARWAELPPKTNMLAVSKGDKADYSRERAAFVRQFYLFSRDYCAGSRLSWSEWLKQQGKR